MNKFLNFSQLSTFKLTVDVFDAVDDVDEKKDVASYVLIAVEKN